MQPTNVKIYSTLSCPYCKMEKSWLDENSIKHEIVYVDTNEEAAREMVSKTQQMGVPVTELTYAEGEPVYVVGFDRTQLTELLLQKA